MPKTATTWQKGTSGNPNGRPPKNRTLTAILERAGNAKVGVDEVAAKKIVADLLWEAASTGRVIFPNGTEKWLDIQEWTGVVRFIYQHIDGPPKSELDVTSNGETLMRVIYGNDGTNDSAT